MTTDQQLAVLCAALHQIAAWQDGDCPDSPAAFTARRALAEIGDASEADDLDAHLSGARFAQGILDDSTL